MTTTYPDGAHAASDIGQETPTRRRSIERGAERFTLGLFLSVAAGLAVWALVAALLVWAAS